jgi:serine/threonine-protein phosphatase 2A regulatory subunit A
VIQKLELGKYYCQIFHSSNFLKSALKSSVKFVNVMGPELMQALSSHLKTLIEDKKWRVREALYNTLFDLALVYQNQDVFIKQIEPLLFGFLKDRAQTIRESSIKRLSSLVQVYKHDWLLNGCLPKFNETLNKQNGYAFRISGLYCLQSIAQNLSTEIVTDKILPILIKNARDDVPNVKLVAVRIIKSLLLKLDQNSVNSQIKPLLQELSNDNDKDVKYFAQEALVSI